MLNHRLHAVQALCALLVVTLPGTAVARAQITPVGRTLHAQATTGGSSHNPPDLIVGPVFGPFSHSAFASEPGRSANGSSSSTINADASMSFTVNATGAYFGSGAAPFASTFQDNVFDLTTAIMFQENVSGTLLNNTFDMHYRISEQTLGVVRSQTHTENTSFTSPPAFFTLQPGHYTIHLDAQSTAGGGAPGGGGITVALTPVPEPASSAVATALVCGYLAARRHTSRTR